MKVVEKVSLPNHTKVWESIICYKRPILMVEYFLDWNRRKYRGGMEAVLEAIFAGDCDIKVWYEARCQAPPHLSMILLAATISRS